MSELTLFTQGGNNLPAHLRNLQIDDTTKALMGGGGGNKRISIRGGVFRMMVEGKEIAQNEDRSMNVVIVRANPNVSRTFYAGTYQEGQSSAPDCWSDDGIAPSAKVAEPQAPRCINCPQNIAGSGQGTSRACRFSQRLAVVLENDLEGSVYQLTLPAQSIFGAAENGKMPLQAYARFMGSHGLPVTAVVTEMRFDTASATPRLTFRGVRPLEPEELVVINERGQSEEAQAAVASTVAMQDAPKQPAFAEEPKQVAAPKPVAKVGPKPAPKAEEPAAEEPQKRGRKPTVQEVEDILDDWAE